MTQTRVFDGEWPFDWKPPPGALKNLIDERRRQQLFDFVRELPDPILLELFNAAGDEFYRRGGE